MVSLPSCPRCHRPVAVARVSCVYCGAPLPEPATAAPPDPETPSAPAPPDRSLLLLDLQDADPGTIAQALGLSIFDAQLRVRRGGPQLLAARTAAAARDEASRLESLGLRVTTVPEAEARLALEPLTALGSMPEQGTLRLRTQRGDRQLSAAELLLIVRGPITREWQPTPTKARQVKTAAPAAGYVFHLHRRAEPRPIEIDADAFELSGSRRHPRSSLLELNAWIARLAEQVSVDDGFRRLPPALAPANVSAGAAAVAAGFGKRSRPQGRDDEPLILDNVAQFRFYSGWRSAFERRRGQS